MEMLWNPDEIGKWAFQKILRNYKNNNQMASKSIDRYIEIISNIENEFIKSKYCYLFCSEIKDLDEIRRLITHPYFADAYCLNIKSDPILEKIIKDCDFDYNYAMSILDDKYRKHVEEKNIFKKFNIINKMEI